MTKMFCGPFARWAWSMAFGKEDGSVYVGLGRAWIWGRPISVSSPQIRFKGGRKERNHFFNILRREQMRQDGEA